MLTVKNGAAANCNSPVFALYMKNFLSMASLAGL